MLRGETTTRSDLTPEALTATVQAHGVDRLRGEESVWVILDGSDLRKPYATAMAGLPRVKRLAGGGTVPGYSTLNAIGLGQAGRRGLLYHRLFSSSAPDVVSESAEERAAMASVGAAVAPLGAEVTWILDAGFDDVARWGDIWTQEHHLLWRLQHADRWVETRGGVPCQLQEVATQLQPLAQIAAEMVVQKTGQARPKLQPVTATVAAVPLTVPWRPGLRTWAEGDEQRQLCWLVEVRLERVDQAPWWLLTDRPVETAEQAQEIFRMYCQRWAIEDAFQVAKTCLGWEDVPVLAYEAVRLLVALGWVAAGFLFDLGVTLEWAAVRRLCRLGGGEDRPNRPPGHPATRQDCAHSRLTPFARLSLAGGHPGGGRSPAWRLTAAHRRHARPPTHPVSYVRMSDTSLALPAGEVQSGLALRSSPKSPADANLCTLCFSSITRRWDSTPSWRLASTAALKRHRRAVPCRRLALIPSRGPCSPAPRGGPP